MAEKVNLQKTIQEYRQTNPKLKNLSDENVLSIMVQNGVISLSEDQKRSVFANNKHPNSNIGLQVEKSAPQSNFEKIIYLQSGRKVVYTKTANGKLALKYYGTDGTQLNPDYFKKVEGQISISADGKTYTITKDGKKTTLQAKDPAKGVIDQNLARLNNEEKRLNKTKNEQGFIGSSWDWIKNKTGIGDGSDKAQKQIEAERKLLNQIKTGKISKKDFKEVTGLDYSKENLEKFKRGELSQATAKIDGYKEGQEMASDVAGDLISGIAAVGIYTAAVAAAPFTGGTSIAVGVAAVTASGALIKAGVKALDTVGTDRKYTLKDFGHDAATGAFSGVLAPITGGLGGAVGKTVATKLGVQAVKQVGKEAAQEAVKGGIKQGIKTALTNPTGYEYVGGNIAKRALAFGAETATDGAVGGAVDNAFRTAYDGGSLEDIGNSAVEGFVGGAIMSPIIGGGIKAVGKGAQQTFGKDNVNIDANGNKVHVNEDETVVKINDNASGVLTDPPDAEIHIPKGAFASDIAPFIETDEGFRNIVRNRSGDIAELNKINNLEIRDILTDKEEPPKPKLNEAQKRAFNKRIDDIKKTAHESLNKDELTKVDELLEILDAHILKYSDDKGRAYISKIEDSHIVELAKIKNLDINRLKTIARNLDPDSEDPIGYYLIKIMKLSDADYNKVCQTLGKHQNNMKFLSALSEIPTESFGRIKTFIESLNLEETDLINLNASFKVVSDMSDESWDRVIQRDLLNELDLKHSYPYADVLKNLAEMDETQWSTFLSRNLMTEKALFHANCLTELTDDEFSTLVALNLFNPETGQLKISEKFITNFTKLTPEQEARLIDYDLLNRDGSRQAIKKSFTVVDGTQVLMMLQLSSADFQKLVDKNLFNIKVNGSPLKTNDIMLLENIEPEVINKIINDIMPLNSKITVKEALVLSKLSKNDLAKIQKFNLFEEKVSSRYFSSDVDGDMVLMLSAFRKAKNGDTDLVNLEPAEVIKIAQQPEEVIPNLLKLLKNKNVEKFAFDDLVKMSKLDDADLEKVISILNQNADESVHSLSYPLKESGNKTTFNETAYKQVQELTKLLYDNAVHADIIIRCCENPDGTHNASAADKIIKALKETSNEQVVSEIVKFSKDNATRTFDERFLDALLDAQSRNVSIDNFNLILKECTDVNGNFDKAIYDKIYELRAARLFEGVIPQILKACKNKNGTFNDEVFRTAFKLQEEGFSSGDIGFVLQAARDLDDNYSAKLLDQIKLKIYSGGWGANNFPAIIKTCIDKNGNLDENVYNILEKLNKSGRMSIDDVVRIAPLFQAFAENLDKNNINELSISEKRTLLKKLIQFNSALFDKHFNMAKQEIGLTSNLLPLSKEDYCALLPKLVKSIGIDTRPLSKEVETGFYRAMDNLSEPNGVLARTDFNSGYIQVELSYPRSQFIENINLLLKDLTPSERNKATDYFGFELINRSDNTVQMNGYPINVNNGAKMTEISEPATKAIIERMRPLVEKFSNNNNCTVKNNPELAQELNNIVKAFPEFLTTIGRKQHGTHDFTIDIHTLKVLQGVITNSRFQKLPEADRKLLQIATLMHDLTKAEGLKDKLHPQYAAYDTYYILEKMNLTEAEKLKVYQLIKNHDWLERFNTAGAKTDAIAKDIAFNLREGNLFEMASILAEADLKGVKASDAFYLKYKDALEIGNSKIRELVDEIQKTSIYLPQSKIPKASELKLDGQKVKTEVTQDSKGNPISNTVIYLNKDMDLSQYGFAEGLKATDLNVLVHGLNYENQSVIFQALGQVDSDALLSTSYITYNKGNYHVFRTQGFVLDVSSTDIHAGSYMDFGSGCGKDMETLKTQYLFNGSRKGLRNFFSDQFKNMLGLSNDEYLKLYNEICDKSITELDKTHPEIANKIRELFNAMEIHKRSHGRDYNEILISRPKIQAIFWQGKVQDNDVAKKIHKKYTIDRVPEFLRKYAEDNDLPIIYFGE